MFMHIKAPDENVLAQLIPEVWWDAQVLYFHMDFLFSLAQLYTIKGPLHQRTSNRQSTELGLFLDDS